MGPPLTSGLDPETKVVEKSMVNKSQPETMTLKSVTLYRWEAKTMILESEQEAVIFLRRRWKGWRLQEWEGSRGSCHQASCPRTHVRSWAMIDVISIKIRWFSECIIGGPNGKWEACIFFACSLDLSKEMTTHCFPYQGLILCLVHPYSFFLDLGQDG